jgi:Uncharacterized protein conserved in bacteria (DUF2219)
MLRWCLVPLLSLLPLAAHADPQVVLGWGRMFNNDATGDMQDRWHTGSYTISQLRGYNWRGTLPTTPFDLWEIKLEAGIVAPEDLVTPDPNDRRYAGMLTLGAHTQFDWQGLETNVGGDLVFTGPQTGISSFQGWVHGFLGMEDATAYDDQIGNAVYPTVTGEIGKTISLGQGMTFRPFAGASAGLETFARIGGDLTLGHFGEGSVMLRDTVTGQRYRGVAGDLITGFSFVAGGDLAEVFSSALLPEDGAAVMSDTRERLRLGVQWQGKTNSMFYGLTYLGPEFDSQPEGQVVGSLNIQLQF